MRNALILLIAAISLSACTNTLEGVKKDSDRAGQKMQRVVEVVSEP
ncbi:MAG: entericidin [Alphaproteobacteria bacterium]|nr:entericidin [Alphaproteobacteria bacterium]